MVWCGVRIFGVGGARSTNHHTDAGGVVAAPAVVGAALGANRTRVSPNPPKAAPRAERFTSDILHLGARSTPPPSTQPLSR